MRIAVIPQRWPTCRGNVWWLRVDTDVIKDLPDLHAIGDKCDQAHLTTAHRAQQRKIGNNKVDQRPAYMNQAMQVRGIDPERRQRLRQISPADGGLNGEESTRCG